MRIVIKVNRKKDWQSKEILNINGMKKKWKNKKLLKLEQWLI